LSITFHDPNMHEPVKYKRLKEIIAELKTQLDAIESGTLSKEDIESATELGRELYERLVVIRHKAYDELIKGKAQEIETSKIVDVEPERITPIPFKIPEVSPNQISLIDVIEELAPETEAEPAKAPELHKPNYDVHFAPLKPAAQVESVYDKIARDIPKKESLSEQIEKAAIIDLKRAISINQRFQFSKELFKNNSQEYEVAIEKLNTVSRDEAMKLMDNLKTKFNWSSESPVANDFKEMVERRHL